ncbi:hypothetical protein [Fuerstiella marisgermanici]|uniref:Uncharacterized protein n=1 Tax=Fuerstiella marisgermanici TaxID=1891926 RepID=A0A1P8WP83_9PLAN|nr:hypothetical protein [Fuerstiella marisgermanici]APZ95855.1 hypothetical protein Fuma_05518 [Fuerstiella marisgermanici]
MFGLFRLEHTSPIARYFRKLRRRLRNLLIVVAVLAAMVVFWGVPHCQWTYKYPAAGGVRVPDADEKMSAWYWNPVSGWKHVTRDQYGPLTFVLFIPVTDCYGDDDNVFNF